MCRLEQEEHCMSGHGGDCAKHWVLLARRANNWHIQCKTQLCSVAIISFCVAFNKSGRHIDCWTHGENPTKQVQNLQLSVSVDITGLQYSRTGRFGNECSCRSGTAGLCVQCCTAAMFRSSAN